MLFFNRYKRYFFEYEDDIIVVDCGLEFPTDDMLGIDLVIPDVTYLVKNKEKVRGMVITHGHEDHIGSIPYVLQQINMPIYATKLTCGLIKGKLEEHHLLRSTKLVEVDAGQTIKLGKFSVEFIRSCHSIPDSVMLAIHTPVGTVVHTGDFKVDYTPMDGKIMDFGRLAELGNKGVLALMSDSTNAERKGFTMSESTVGEVFEKLFTNCTKRIVVATFASNVHRVQQIVNCAVKYGRKIAVCGRSMINMITTARELGYIECPDNLFIDIDMINNYTDDQLLIITTGSQGETMSALTRMASGTHRKVKITPNDLVIISANPIPGNEKNVSKVIDSLMQIGAEVVYSALEDVHVSGHACQEEQKLILALTKPKYFIPVHGEYRHLIAHSETAKLMGVPKENIFKLENGKILEMDKNSAAYKYTVGKQETLFDDDFLTEKARLSHRVIGQVFETYWLIEYNDNLYIMDQHAAHEKVKYEELMENLKNKQVFSQQLLPPMVITVTYAERQAILDNFDLFMKIGYDIEEFGGNEFKINAIPSNLFGLHGRDMFLEFVGSLIQNSGYMSNDIFVKKLSTMACKAAVKGNMKLSFQEIDALVDKLLSLENPYTCPHGRPTIISMSKTELEKKFHRIVS